MKYICMEDIETLAAQGKKELVVDGNTVVMDLARDLARQLGIVIVDGTQAARAKATSPSAAAAPAAPAKAASPAPATPAAREAAPKLGAKPKGCQHGPLPAAAARPEQPKSQSNADAMIEQVVELLKQSSGKRSGN